MSLNLLSDAALLGRTLQDLQDQMTAMRGEIAALRGASQSSSSAATAITPAHDGSQPGTSGYLSSSRISGTSWAEEMDIIQPLDNDDAPDADVSCSEGARVVEVSEATQKLLKRSFESMKNSQRLQTRNDFSLPKVAITKTPSLDQMMASQCSKSTKSNDWSLSRIQALMLDAVAPLTEVMELFHSEADEVSSEQIAKAVEAAITLLGNASCQMSALRRTRVLQEYNRDLVEWAQNREEKFNEEAPALFGQSFPKDVSEYLDQVASLKKAKATANPSSSSGFRKAYSYRPANKQGYRYAQKHRPAPYPQVRQPGSRPKKPQK